MAKKTSESTEAIRAMAIEAILDKKGQDLVSLDLRDIHDTISDYFIIAHGDSNTQVNAIFQSVLESAKKAGHQPYHSEGMKNGEWVIVDFVDVVVHIFHREKREFYQLEELWNDAKVTKHDPEAAIKPKTVRPSIKHVEDAPYEDEAPKKAVARKRPAAPKAATVKKAAAPKKAAAGKKAAAPRKAAASKKAPATKKTTTKKK